MPETVHTTAPTGAQQSDGENAAGQAQEKAKEVASQAQDKAKEAAGQARGRVRDQVDERSTQLGERVKSNASDARTVVDELRKQGKDAPARYVEQAADRAERDRRLSRARATASGYCATSRTSAAATPGRWRPAACCSASRPPGC